MPCRCPLYHSTTFKSWLQDLPASIFELPSKSPSFRLRHSANEKLFNVYVPHSLDKQWLEEFVLQITVLNDRRIFDRKTKINCIEKLARRKHLVHTGNRSLICCKKNLEKLSQICYKQCRLRIFKRVCERERLYVCVCVHVWVFETECESVCENQGRPQGCHVNIMLQLLWTNSFVEDVTTISNPRSLTSVRIKDCILRVPNKTISLFHKMNHQFTTLLSGCLRTRQTEKQKEKGYIQKSGRTKKGVVCTTSTINQKWIFAIQMEALLASCWR